MGGHDEFMANASAICLCKNLFIRITKTQAVIPTTGHGISKPGVSEIHMPSKILVSASEAILMFAAWYPTARQLTVYVRFDGRGKAFNPEKAFARRSNEIEAYTDNVIQKALPTPPVPKTTHVSEEMMSAMPTHSPTYAQIEMNADIEAMGGDVVHFDAHHDSSQYFIWTMIATTSILC